MTISQIGRQKNIISFKSDSQINLEEASNADLYRIATTSDEYLQTSSRKNEAQKFINDPVRKIEKKTSQAIPVADTLLTAALTPGNFGDKVFAGVARAVEWTVFTKITNNLSQKLNKNKTFRTFSQEHPAMASFVGSLAVSAIGILGYVAVKTGFNKFVERYKPASSFKQTIHQDLNKFAAGKKISKFLNKNKKYTAAAAVAGFVGIVALSVNQLVSLARMKKDADRNTEKYKDFRLEASRELNNRLLAEQTSVAETE